MKKKILISIVVIVVIAAGVLGYAAMNASSLVKKFQPDLERIASSALGSNVTLGDLDVSVFPDAHINIKEMRIARTKQAKEGLALKNLVLDIRLLPLLSKKLEIVTLGLEHPELTFLRDKTGVSIAGLPKRSASKEDQTKTLKVPTGNKGGDKAPKQKSALPEGLKLSLERFEIDNAQLTFKDLISGKDYAVTDIDVGAALDVSGDVATISDLRVDGRILGKAGLSVSGPAVTYNLKENSADFSKVILSVAKNNIELGGQFNAGTSKGSADLKSNQIDLASLIPLVEVVAPAAGSFGVSGSIAPSLDIAFGPAPAFSAKGTTALLDIAAKASGFAVSDLKGDLSLDVTKTKQEVSSENISLAFNGAPIQAVIKAVLQNEKAQLSKLHLNAFSGSVDGDVTLSLTDKKPFDLNLGVAGLAIQPAVKAVKPDLPVTLVGTVESLKAAIRGQMGAQLMQSLSGKSRVQIKDGALKEVNLAGDTLRAITGLPFLSGALYDAIPSERRGVLEQADTEIKSLTADFQIGNGRLATQNLKVVNPIFDLLGDGSVGFDATVDLNAELVFSPDFTNLLVASVKELKHALNSENRLVIPLRLTGKASKLRVLPNVERLVKLAAQRAIEDKAVDLIDKAVGDKLGGSLGKDGTKDAIKKGLGGLLGGF